MLITQAEVADFNNRWKSKLKAYGVTEFALSTHFNANRLNHKRNVPPLTIKELDFVLEGFLNKVGIQFKKDVENVKNHTAKRRGVNKNQIPENELEFAITSNSTHVKFVFVLKQDWHKKGTAIVLPMTIIRKKKFRVIKGEQVIVEDYINEAKVVHWKQSKFSTYAKCDKRGAEALKLSNCKHTEKPIEVTCKKCRKEYMGLRNPNIWS
jgi:hypothetical protein